MAETMRCYRHPERETRVSCATCGRPICTECMVQTEVGIKCPDDARMPRGARAGVMKGNQVARSLLAGVAVALLGVPVVYAIFEIGFFSLILSALAGFGAGTLVHRAGGRNGGPLAMAISGVAVAAAYAPFLVQALPAGNVMRLLAVLVAVGFAVYNSR
ncbi:MAG TPA: B-box zinc finger protein [Rubrobacteraceae bacterium]|jgi:hypothetical protein|nr:B-box zinc finger protein [Rubrobacteraceae bacterium]